MKVRFEKDGTAFEFDCPPMPVPRFRALCLLAAGWLYVKALVGVASICGIQGVIALVILSVIALGIASI